MLLPNPASGPKTTAYVDACPVDCIHPKKNTTYDDGHPGFEAVLQLYIDPVDCIDCGACVPVCPVSAIFALDDPPEKWKPSRGAVNERHQGTCQHSRTTPLRSASGTIWGR